MERKRIIHLDVEPSVEGIDIVKRLLAVDTSRVLLEDMEGEVKMLGRLIHLLRQHLVMVGLKQAMPLRYISVRQAGQLFLHNYKRAVWNTAVKNFTAADLLFIAVCHAEVCHRPDRALKVRVEEDNFQQLNAELFELGRGWHNLAVATIPDAGELFQRCATWVVRVFGKGPDGIKQAIKLCESKLLTDDGSHPGLSSHGRRRTPVDAKEAEKIERDAKRVLIEKRNAREQHVSLLVSNFIPICTRVFMHIWADDYMLNCVAKIDNSCFDLPAADAEFAAAQVEAAAAAAATATDSKSAGGDEKAEAKASELLGAKGGGPIHKWMFDNTRSLHAISAELQAAWRVMPTRQALALGAVYYSRRQQGRESANLSADRLFQAEASEEQQSALRKFAKITIPEIAADPTHELYNLLLLTFYAFRFHIEFENADYFQTLFVLNDDVPRMQDLIRADSTPEGKPRLPVGVQMRGEFFLNHNGKWLPFGRHLEQLLLFQLKIITTEFDGKLSTGESLTETWAKEFI